ncbi:winged helix-turn-helix domain-containing protein [Streptomyces sp. NPDC005438]|uniref:winged helix-turn-helix domain-containing protein n=1 Tax=Streptomyces sp. NPDC005438 TaxID=3156880 RepID=UPI0033BBD2BD
MAEHHEDPVGHRAPDAEAAVLDAKGLRVLAHPVRVQLVGLLRKFGPSTATQLAQRLNVNTGSASYHLRQLGAVGLVEEDRERGNARERWWRAAHRVTRFDDPELVESEPEAALAYMRSVARVYTLRCQQALDEAPAMPPAWQNTLDMSDRALRLTVDEAHALREELQAVLGRYRADHPETPAPEDAERVSVIVQVLPELDVPPVPSEGRSGE